MNENRKVQRTRVGAITIGQSSRVDIMGDIKNLLGDKFEIVERGALDAFDYEYVRKNFYPEGKDTVLISRMRDGRQVKLSEEKIIPLLQESIQYLEQRECKIILMMCTGKFPKFQHKLPLITPQGLLHEIVKKISDERKIGLIIPDADQAEYIKQSWTKDGVEVEIEIASPYGEELNIKKASESFRNKNVAFIFMDCMGYSVGMKKEVRRISEKPVLLPRTLISRIIKELFE